jgi:hypothetical protein
MSDNADHNWCSSVCPIQPHELDSCLRAGMNEIVRKVVAQSVAEGGGQDIFLRVYLAGMYHGQEIASGGTQ